MNCVANRRTKHFPLLFPSGFCWTGRTQTLTMYFMGWTLKCLTCLPTLQSQTSLLVPHKQIPRTEPLLILPLLRTSVGYCWTLSRADGGTLGPGHYHYTTRTTQSQILCSGGWAGARVASPLPWLAPLAPWEELATRPPQLVSRAWGYRFICARTPFHIQAHSPRLYTHIHTIP